MSMSAGSRRPRRQRTIMAEQALGCLKRDILRCHLPPGSRVTEQALADQYGFGRAAVRTALAQLGQEGLVTPVPQVGYQVRSVTLKDAADLFDARLVLESHVVGRVAEAAGADEIRALAELGSVDCTMGDPASVDRYLRANDAFHRLLASIAGNAQIERFLAQTLERLETFMYLGHMARRAGAIVSDGRHVVLVDRIAARDASGAQEVLRQHLESARQRTFAALVESPALQGINLA